MWWWRKLESPLDCKEIQPVNSTGNQFWIFIWRTDAKAVTPILWPPNAKNWLIGKDLMWGKIEGTKRRGQQRMRRLDGITDWMDVSLGSGSWWWTEKPSVLQSRGHKESDMTEWVNWTELLRRVLLLDSKEIKPVNLKGNQPWILVRRTDAEVETTVFWSFDVNS